MAEHRMTTRDLEAGTGVCAVCGPVTLRRVNKGGGRQAYLCPNGAAAGRGVRHGHGLTRGESRRLRLGQSCALCGEPAMAVDHDHATGALRGLLCAACNIGLGSFRDRPDLLERAAEYLRNPPGVTRP